MLDPCSCNAQRIICDACYLVCTGCGITIYNPHITYTPTSKTRNFYSRINYLKEVLRELTGDIRLEIPKDLEQQIIMELRIYWMLLDAAPCYATLKIVLKKHKLRQYYPSIPYLLQKWFNLPPLELTVMQRDYILRLFRRVERDFDRTKGNRHNFFSYYLFMSIMLTKLGIPCDWIPKKPVDPRQRNWQASILCELIDRHAA